MWFRPLHEFRQVATHLILALAILLFVHSAVAAGPNPPEAFDATGIADVQSEPQTAGGVSATVLPAGLADNAKLVNAKAILADFAQGKTETAVIVTLQPTTEAETLAAESLSSPNRSKEFQRAGAPTYYDLQNLDIRNRLYATVTAEVDRVVNELNTPGMTVTQRFSYQFGFAARVTPQALDMLTKHPSVIRVEKDGEVNAHLRQGIPLMNASTPRSSYDGTGVSIAICDTGIDTSHSMLGGGGQPIFNSKVIGGYNTGDGNSDPRSNGQPHGTECAGIAAGNIGNTGDYIGGVAPGAKLYALKITSGSSGSTSDSNIIAAWNWAITHQHDDANNPIMIISTSFGGGSYQSACDGTLSSYATAAAAAVSAGITLFGSSGNDGYCNSIASPACISYVNSVGAVYDAAFGTYYPCINASSCAPTKASTNGCATGWYATDYAQADMVTSYSNSASFLTLFAPSNEAYTTTIVGTGDSGGDYNSTFGGTSAACPYAAGAAAVLQCAAKAKTGAFLTPAQVKQYLTANGDSVTDGKVAVTKPRINLGQAVNALQAAGGSVTVTISPAGAITAGAQWNVDGGTWRSSGATVSSLSAGSHTVAFSTVSGWTTPSSQTVTISNGQTTTAVGTYVQLSQSGSVTVTISPAGAISAGAQWNVDGGTWQSSGDTVSGLSVGSHTVAFSTVSGWTTPSSQTVTISNGQTTTAAGTYVQLSQSGSLTVTITPAEAITAGAQWNVDGGAWQSSGDMVNLSVGSHTVTYRDLSGWTTPAPHNVKIAKNKTAKATGKYVQQLGSLKVTLSPSKAKAGAWSLDEGSWLKSGATVKNLLTTPHLVTFMDVDGWVTPAPQQVLVVDRKTTTATGVYVMSSQQTVNLAPYNPSGWSDDIVVAKTTGCISTACQDSASISTTDTVYVNFAFANYGNVDINNTFYSTISVDGVVIQTWNTASLSAGYFAYVRDYSIGSLAAGTHVITLAVDSLNDVSESNEKDNNYTKIIAVVQP